MKKMLISLLLIVMSVFTLAEQTKFDKQREINEFYDVLSLNKMIFGYESKENKHKSYDSSTITKVLTYQKENNLSNVEVAQKFNLSRNTVSAWKKRMNFTKASMM